HGITVILEMTPGSGGGFGDATLLAGSTYTDSAYNVSISVSSVSSTLATVRVSSASVSATSTSVSSSINPANAGSMVTFTGTVTGHSPTGSVTFTSNGSTVCVSTLSSGSAQCSASNLPTGTDSIVATYGGDSGNAASTSPTLSQQMMAVADTTPPTVTISNPGDGTQVSGMVPI